MKGFLKLSPCFLAIIVDIMGFGLVYPMMTVLFAGDSTLMVSADTSAQLKAFYLGLGYLLYPLFMFFGGSFLGDLSDAYGRKRTLVWCMMGLVIGFSLMGVGIMFRSITLLMIGRALTGLMAGSQPIALAAVADMSTPETKARNMSLMSFVISMGVVIGPLVGGIFSDPRIFHDFNVRTPFYVAAILSVVAAFWVGFGLNETRKTPDDHKIDFFRPVKLFIEAFYHPGVRLMASVFLMLQIAFALYFQLSSYILKTEFDYSSGPLGVFTAYIGVWFAVGLLLVFPLIEKRMRIASICGISYIVTSVGLFLTAISPNDLMIWFVAILTAVGDIIAYTTSITIFSNCADESRQGWVMGIFAATVAIAWVISGALANFLPEIGASGLLCIGAVLSCVAGILVIVLRSHFHVYNEDKHS